MINKFIIIHKKNLRLLLCMFYFNKKISETLKKKAPIPSLTFCSTQSRVRKKKQLKKNYLESCNP